MSTSSTLSTSSWYSMEVATPYHLGYVDMWLAINRGKALAKCGGTDADEADDQVAGGEDEAGAASDADEQNGADENEEEGELRSNEGPPPSSAVDDTVCMEVSSNEPNSSEQSSVNNCAHSNGLWHSACCCPPTSDEAVPIGKKISIPQFSSNAAREAPASIRPTLDAQSSSPRCSI